MIKCNKTILSVMYKILNSSKIIINYQLLLFCLPFLFGTAHAITINDTPIFDVSFENLKTGEENHFYENPIKVVSSGNVKITYSPTDGESMTKVNQANERVLVYANGISTNKVKAAFNLNKIQTLLDGRYGISEYHTAFNQPEDFLPQLAQVTTQHLMQENNSTERQAWKEFAYRLLQPHKYNILDNAESLVSLFDEDNYVNDQDLQYHINDIYLPLLEDNKKVVILAHSQGNFYANRGWNAIKQLPNGDILSKQIGVVAVATPANYIAGDGLYTTNSLDLVIAGINLTALNPKAANATHPFSLEDITGHGLTEIYLDSGIDGTIIRNKIEEDIDTTFNRLIVDNPTCEGLSSSGSGNTEITGYTPAENFEGNLYYSINAFSTIQNRLTIKSEYGTNLVGSGFFSNTNQGYFYYSWENYKSLEIIIDKGYDPDGIDRWELNITCPL